MSEELEKIGLEAVFETLAFKKRSDEYVRSLADANKKTAEAAADMSENMAASAEGVDTSWHRMATAALQQGSSIKDVAQYVGASREEVLAFAQSSDQAATSSFQAAIAAEKQATAVKKAGKEARKSASYLGRYLKRLVLWVTVGAAVRGAIRMITRNLKDGFKALYENTDEYKNLTSASERFRNSLVLSVAPLEQTLELMDKLAAAANRYADAMERHVAGRETQQTAIQEIARRNLLKTTPGMTKEDRMAVAQMMYQTAQGIGLTEKQIKALDEISKRYEWGIDVLGTYNQKLEENREATSGAAEAQEEMAKAARNLADILKDADDELGRHAKALREIHRIYDEEVGQAMVDWYQENAKIARESADEIAEIEADAAADIEKLRAKTNKRLKELQNRARRDDRNDEERHQLEMQFARRRYELTAIQNKRMYQARRRRLVGEGDVLAIEELDEQYELQRQAAEENFRLQMQQAEAMYRMQAKIQEESMRVQADILRQAMEEQIAEIEAAKKKEIEEAEAAAAEEAALNEQKRKQALYDAKVARDEALWSESEAHKERMGAIAQQVIDFADKYDIEMELLDAVVEHHWGEGSVMDRAVKGAFDRWQMYAAQATAYMQNLMGRAGGAYLGAFYGARIPATRPGRQAGTTGGRPEIHSRPGLVPVAEGGRAERVSVQPLYPTGSVAMSLSWTGRPIPVRGEGSLSGADLDALGSSIAVAIVSRSKQAYQNMYAPGG